jgi:phosphomannomutase
MDFDRTAFRAYEIRGMVPDQLSPEAAYLIGNSLSGYLKPASVAVGQDGQSLSATIFDALSSGILDRGADVVDLGPIPLEALYFAIGANDYDGGVMIAASHDPPEAVSLGLFGKGAEPLYGPDVFDIIADDLSGDRVDKTGVRGTIVRKDISAAYAEHVLSFIDPTAIKPYSIVIATSGAIDRILSLVFERLPCKIIPTQAQPGTSDSLESLKKMVVDNGADFGVALFSDAGPTYVLHGGGEIVDGDMMTALIAESVLAISRQETIIYDVASSRSVRELIRARGGVAIRSAGGHANFTQLMRRHNAVLGGERPGHYYFRDNWFADSALIALLICLERFSRDGRPAAEIAGAINPYIRSREIIESVADLERTLDDLAAAFSDGKAERIDGLAVEYADWWFHVRPSRTEPSVRLNVEAVNDDILKEKVGKLLKVIRS